MTQTPQRTAIVTGAAHGIGLAIARRLVRAGASVMMADRDEGRLAVAAAACATLLAARGQRLRALRATDPMCRSAGMSSTARKTSVTEL